MYTYLYVYVYIHTYMYVRAYVHTCMYARHVCTYMYVCMYVHGDSHGYLATGLHLGMGLRIERSCWSITSTQNMRPT